MVKGLPRQLTLIPDNFSFTQSWDGKYDDMIEGIGEKSARVFIDPDELKASGLEHDHDDSHAIHNKRGRRFRAPYSRLPAKGK